jgi:hypothetical protein
MTVLVAVEPSQNLRYSRPTDAEVAGDLSPILRDSGIDQTLVESGQCQWITVNTLGFSRGRRERLRAVPGMKFDDVLSS